MDKLIKLAYIKDGKIHTKDYPVGHEKDWELLVKSGLPSFMLSYKNDSKYEDRVLLPAKHAAHWTLEENVGTPARFRRVPEDKWPDWLASSVDEELKTNELYRGCRFSCWNEAGVYMVEHIWWWDKEAGLQIQDITILDRNSGALCWSRFD